MQAKSEPNRKTLILTDIEFDVLSSLVLSSDPDPEDPDVWRELQIELLEFRLHDHVQRG